LAEFFAFQKGVSRIYLHINYMVPAGLLHIHNIASADSYPENVLELWF